MTQRPPDWDVPVLDRMREDFAELTARDAAALRAERPVRRRAGWIAATAAAVCLLVVVLANRDGAEALAGIPAAPGAAERAGSFSYRTVLTVTGSGGEQSSVQSGAVSVREQAFTARVADGGGRGAERVGVAGQLYYRIGDGRSGVGSWQQVPLAGPVVSRLSEGPATAAPVSNNAIRSLLKGGEATTVSEDERAGGVAVTHYRLTIDAATFLGIRGVARQADLDDVRGVVEVWLDAEDRPRRIRARFRAPATQDAVVVDTSYRDYGSDLRIRAPRSSLRAPPGAALNDPIALSVVAGFAR